MHLFFHVLHQYPISVYQNAYRSPGSFRSARHHNRAASWSQRLVSALSNDRYAFREDMRGSKDLIGHDERVWYDQFTSTDWVHDSIADAYRVKELRSRKDIRGRIIAFFDGTQGWILSALVGFVTAVVAYTVNVSEAPVFDWKDGYCQNGFHLSEKVCGAPFGLLS
jgi:chloride channel 3/4/5